MRIKVKKLSCIIVILLIIPLCLTLVACQDTFASSIDIIGDVNTVVTIDNLTQATASGYIVKPFVNVNIKVDNKSYNAIDVSALMTDLVTRQSTGDNEGFSVIKSGYFSIILVARDNTTTKIDGGDLQQLYIYYDSTNLWCGYSEIHPMPVRLLDIVQVIVVENLPILTTDEFWGFRVIGDNCDYVTTSVGNEIEQQLISYTSTSSVTKNDITVKKGKLSDSKSISDISIDLQSAVGQYLQYTTLFTTDGDIVKISGSSYGKLTITECDIVYTVDNNSYNLICMGLSDNINTTIADIAVAVKESLYDSTVIIIELDGYSYKQYITMDGYTQLKQALPTNAQLTANAMYAVMPTKSEVGLASILSGKSPKDNGVLNSYQKSKFTQDNILSYALAQGKSVSYLEGKSIMLNTTPMATTHASDVITYNSFVSAINGGKLADLTYVHLHEIDDVGSDKGPYHNDTADKIAQQLNYIATIFDKAVQSADSVVLYVVSDHGMHASGSGGYHTTATYEDMVVPFLTITLQP